MIFETIQNRRSIYPAQFNNERVPKEVINTLLEAANWAPSHYKTEPWRFKVIYSKEAKESFGEFISETYKDQAPKFSALKYKKLQAMPIQSGAIIAICMQRDEQERMPEWEETAAVAMAIQNLWLQATEMGLGGFWSSPSVIIRDMHQFFEFKDGEDCMGFFYLGYYDELPENANRGAVEEKTKWL